MSDVNSIADAELIRRAVASCLDKRRGRKQPLWASVGDRFCLGSTYSKQLCRRFGFDPDRESKS